MGEAQDLLGYQRKGGDPRPERGDLGGIRESSAAVLWSMNVARAAGVATDLGGDGLSVWTELGADAAGVGTSV